MEIYFQINLITSLLVLSVVKWGKGSSKANFYLLSLALIAWCMPFTWLPALLPAEILVEPLVFTQQVSNTEAATVATIASLIDVGVFVEQCFFALCGFGVLLFIGQALRAKAFYQMLFKDNSLTFDHALSDKYQVPIYYSELVSCGILVGVKQPQVIISKNIKSSCQIECIIAHEKSHLAQHDNMKLMFLTGMQCVFWWNPIVRALVAQSRFYIEALCDERASQHIGAEKYAANLAALMLSNQQSAQQAFVSTAISNTNNMSRLKLIMEKRVMTKSKKLTYWLTALTAVTVMVFNTFATATTSMHKSTANGVLADFDVSVNSKTVDGTDKVIKSSQAKFSVWAEFDQHAAFGIGDNYRFEYQVSEQGEFAKVDMKIIEITEGNEKEVAKPILKVAYQQEAMIEIDNPEVSSTGYAIRFTAVKSAKPE